MRRTGLVVVALFVAAFSCHANTGVWTNDTKKANNVNWTDALNWENGYVPTNTNDSASFPAGVATDDQDVNSIRLVTLPDTNLTLNALSGEAGTTLVGGSTGRTFSFLTAEDFLGTFKLGNPHTISFRADSTTTSRAPRINVTGRTVINVPDAGGTLEVSSLYGNAHADKTGAGTLSIVNGGGQQTRLNVREACTVELVGAPSDMTAAADDIPAPYLWFDADVRDSLTVSDGRVTKWIDVRSVTDNVARTYLQQWGDYGCPLLAADAVNGHDVVDFGPRVTSGGCALRLSTDYTLGLGRPELFVAFECTSPSNNPTLFSDDANKKYQSSTANGPDIALFDTSTLCPGARNGEIRIDGNQMWYADTYRPRGGFRTLMIANDQTGANRFRGFGCERTGHFGGMRIGEILVYSSPLSTDQRRRVRNYLQRKWCSGDNAAEWELGVVQLCADTTLSVPAGRTARVQKISTPTARSLTVSGGGTLETALLANPPHGRQFAARYNSAAPMPVTISSGATLRVVPGVAADSGAALPDNPYIHLDASRSDTITEIDGNVTEWRDVRSDSTMRAVAGTDSTYKVKHLAGDMNGRDVISTGTLYNNSHGAYFDIYKGENAVSLYAGTCREAFIAGRAVRAGDGWGRALFLANNNHRIFWPGNATGGDNHGGLITGYYASSKLNEGCTPSQLDNYIAIDGVPVDPPTYEMITNPVLISVAFNAAQRFNALAHHGSTMRGGVDYGEVLVYDRSLTPQERRNVEAYLLKKWRGIDTHPENAPVKTGALSVQSGATLAVAAGAGVSVSGALSLASGATVRVEALSSESAPITVSGTATVAGDGTFDFSKIATGTQARGRYPIVSASAIQGDCGGWSIIPADLAARTRIVTKGNTVYVSMQQGLTLVIR